MALSCPFGEGLPFRAKEGIPGPLGGALFPPFKPEEVGRGRWKTQPEQSWEGGGRTQRGGPGEQAESWGSSF